MVVEDGMHWVGVFGNCLHLEKKRKENSVSFIAF